MSGLQRFPYQSLTFHLFPQISIGAGIWFGTRGSEVQILSPRPIFSMSYRDIFPIDISNGVDFVAVKASQFNKLKLREEYRSRHGAGRETAAIPPGRRLQAGAAR